MANVTNRKLIDPQDTLRIIKKLKSFGFEDEEFWLVHQWGRRGRLSAFRKHCNETQRFREDENNHRLHERLAFVLALCEAGALNRGKTFEMLAVEAFHEHPKI
jgi:hypothetical protein